MKDTSYKSDIYYDVVIKGLSYNGWSCPYCGLGKMMFMHPSKGDFIVNKGSSDNWMEECWDDFLKHAEEIK